MLTSPPRLTAANNNAWHAKHPGWLSEQAKASFRNLGTFPPNFSNPAARISPNASFLFFNGVPRCRVPPGLLISRDIYQFQSVFFLPNLAVPAINRGPASFGNSPGNFRQRRDQRTKAVRRRQGSRRWFDSAGKAEMIAGRRWRFAIVHSLQTPGSLVYHKRVL